MSAIGEYLKFVCKEGTTKTSVVAKTHQAKDTEDSSKDCSNVLHLPDDLRTHIQKEIELLAQQKKKRKGLSGSKSKSKKRKSSHQRWYERNAKKIQNLKDDEREAVLELRRFRQRERRERQKAKEAYRKPEVAAKVKRSREQHKKYRSTEIYEKKKAKAREQYKKPEVSEKKKAQVRAYYKKPEICEKKKAQARQQYNKKRSQARRHLTNSSSVIPDMEKGQPNLNAPATQLVQNASQLVGKQQPVLTQANAPGRVIQPTVGDQSVQPVVPRIFAVSQLPGVNQVLLNVQPSLTPGVFSIVTDANASTTSIVIPVIASNVSGPAMVTGILPTTTSTTGSATSAPASLPSKSPVPVGPPIPIVETPGSSSDKEQRNSTASPAVISLLKNKIASPVSVSKTLKSEKSSKKGSTPVLVSILNKVTPKDKNSTIVKDTQPVPVGLPIKVGSLAGANSSAVLSSEPSASTPVPVSLLKNTISQVSDDVYIDLEEDSGESSEAVRVSADQIELDDSPDISTAQPVPVGPPIKHSALKAFVSEFYAGLNDKTCVNEETVVLVVDDDDKGEKEEDVQRSKPEVTCEPSLVVSDKTAVADVDGILMEVDGSDTESADESGELIIVGETKSLARKKNVSVRKKKKLTRPVPIACLKVLPNAKLSMVPIPRPGDSEAKGAEEECQETKEAEGSSDEIQNSELPSGDSFVSNTEQPSAEVLVSNPKLPSDDTEATEENVSIPIENVVIINQVPKTSAPASTPVKSAAGPTHVLAVTSQVLTQFVNRMHGGETSSSNGGKNVTVAIAGAGAAITSTSASHCQTANVSQLVGQQDSEITAQSEVNPLRIGAKSQTVLQSLMLKALGTSGSSTAKSSAETLSSSQHPAVGAVETAVSSQLSVNTSQSETLPMNQPFVTAAQSSRPVSTTGQTLQQFMPNPIGRSSDPGLPSQTPIGQHANLLAQLQQSAAVPFLPPQPQYPGLQGISSDSQQTNIESAAQTGQQPADFRATVLVGPLDTDGLTSEEIAQLAAFNLKPPTSRDKTTLSIPSAHISGASVTTNAVTSAIPAVQSVISKRVDKTKQKQKKDATAANQVRKGQQQECLNYGKRVILPLRSTSSVASPTQTDASASGKTTVHAGNPFESPEKTSENTSRSPTILTSQEIIQQMTNVANLAKVTARNPNHVTLQASLSVLDDLREKLTRLAAVAESGESSGSTSKPSQVCSTSGNGVSQSTVSTLSTRTASVSGNSPATNPVAVSVALSHSNSEVRFVCEVCEKVFKEKDSMADHIRTRNAFPYLCPICGKRICHFASIKPHIVKCGSSAMNTPTTKSFPGSVLNTSAQVQTVSSSQSNPGNNLVASTIVRGVSTGQAGGTSTDGVCTMNLCKRQSSPSLDKRTLMNGGLSCNLCDKYFESEEHWRRHHQMTHNNKSYTSTVSGTSSLITSATNRFPGTVLRTPVPIQSASAQTNPGNNLVAPTNVRGVSAGQASGTSTVGVRTMNLCRRQPSPSKNNSRPMNWHSCDLCDQYFWNVEDLKSHRQITHNNKPYTCPVCGKYYGLLSNYKQHRYGKNSSCIPKKNARSKKVSDQSKNSVKTQMVKPTVRPNSEAISVSSFQTSVPPTRPSTNITASHPPAGETGSAPPHVQQFTFNLPGQMPYLPPGTDPMHTAMSHVFAPVFNLHPPQPGQGIHPTQQAPGHPPTQIFNLNPWQGNPVLPPPPPPLIHPPEVRLPQQQTAPVHPFSQPVFLPFLHSQPPALFANTISTTATSSNDKRQNEATAESDLNEAKEKRTPSNDKGGAKCGKTDDPETAIRVNEILRKVISNQGAQTAPAPTENLSPDSGAMTSPKGIAGALLAGARKNVTKNLDGSYSDNKLQKGPCHDVAPKPPAMMDLRVVLKRGEVEEFIKSSPKINGTPSSSPKKQESSPRVPSPGKGIAPKPGQKRASEERQLRMTPHVKCEDGEDYEIPVKRKKKVRFCLARKSCYVVLSTVLLDQYGFVKPEKCGDKCRKEHLKDLFQCRLVDVEQTDEGVM